MGHGFQLAGIDNLWLAGLNIVRDCLSRSGVCAHVTGGDFHRFLREHWQSPCIALTTDICLSSGLCKGTVKGCNSTHKPSFMGYHRPFWKLSLINWNVFEIFDIQINLESQSCLIWNRYRELQMAGCHFLFRAHAETAVTITWTFYWDLIYSYQHVETQTKLTTFHR